MNIFFVKTRKKFSHLAWGPWAYVRPPGRGVWKTLPPALAIYDFHALTIRFNLCLLMQNGMTTREKPTSLSTSSLYQRLTEYWDVLGSRYPSTIHTDTLVSDAASLDFSPLSSSHSQILKTTPSRDVLQKSKLPLMKKKQRSQIATVAVIILVLRQQLLQQIQPCKRYLQMTKRHSYRLSQPHKTEQ